MCGEKRAERGPQTIAQGSPPRVRGKDGNGNTKKAYTGITPACAGKSGRYGSPHSVSQDHPRVCGEKNLLVPWEQTNQGSPPRVRGKVPYQKDKIKQRGITPACAGKSRRGLLRRTAVRGSPPRVRGKAGGSSGVCLIMGITPACAGKSSSAGSVWQSSRDHPRVCGEKRNAKHVQCYYVGSPPRVRGKGPPPRYSGICTGITPACAGKRLKRSHSIGHFSCILYLFHSVLHVSGGSRAGPCAPPCLPAQNAVPV